jgi:hypothetical protein
MKLEQFAMMRGMENAYTSSNFGLIDHLLSSEDGDALRKNVLTKRLQFDCVPELHSRVESVCSLLGCSKRELLEMVVIDGCNKAEEVFMQSFKDAHGEEFTTVYAANEVHA